MVKGCGRFFFFMADPILIFHFLYFGTLDAPDPSITGKPSGHARRDKSLFAGEIPCITRDDNSRSP